MPFGYTLPTLALILGVVLLGGLVKGLAGFGYAIASTAILATLLQPVTAIVLMILPMLMANLALVTHLDRDGIRSCLRRFWPFVVAALAGTTLGMAALGRVPARWIATGLGVFTIAYVLVTQETVAIPGERWIVDRCFTAGVGAKVGLGAVSGIVFGASNVAVQIVAYLDALDLDRATFAGVLSMILVGVSAVRLGIAWWLGLFDAGGTVALSAIAAVPGLVGVTAGDRIRDQLPERYVEIGALVLLAVIGLRLAAKGLLGV